MAPDIELAINLQRLDNRILELKRDIAALPKHIQETEKALLSHQRRLEADEAALSANLKERRQLEAEVKVHEEKISKLKNQMLGAKTNEQYRAFLHEISFGEEAIRKAEDRILDLMGESEPLEENVKRAKAALKLEQAAVEREKEAARQRAAADEAELATRRAERQQVAAALSPALLASYERIRKRYGGGVVADGSSGKCSACNIALRPQYFQDLKKGEELLPCESCKRLLFYNAPVDVEAEAG